MVECKSEQSLTESVINQLFREVDLLRIEEEKRGVLIIVTLGMTGQFHVFQWKNWPNYFPTSYEFFSPFLILLDGYIKVVNEERLKDLVSVILFHLKVYRQDADKPS